MQSEISVKECLFIFGIKEPTNVHLHYPHQVISTALLRHVSALKSYLQGVLLIHFHSQISKMCTKCENSVYCHVTKYTLLSKPNFTSGIHFVDTDAKMHYSCSLNMAL